MAGCQRGVVALALFFLRQLVVCCRCACQHELSIIVAIKFILYTLSRIRAASREGTPNPHLEYTI